MRPASATPRALGVGLVTLVIAIAFEGMAVSTAMPAAAADLGQIDLYAWAFSLFTLGMVVSTVIAGRLCDRIGPVRPLAVAYLMFAAGLLAGGFSHSMYMLIAARFVQGLGAGALNLAMTVVIAHAFDAASQSRMMSWISAGWVLPSFVGPPLAAWVTKTWSWHWVFFGILPIMVVSALLAGPPLLHVHATHEVDEHADHDPAPIWTGLVLAVGVALLQLAGQRLTWLSLVLFAGALALIVVALRVLMPAGFFVLRSGIPATAWARALLAGTFFAAQSFIPLMLVETRGMTLFVAGLTLTVGSVGWVAGSYLQSRPWFRLRRDEIITLGVLGVVVGLASMSAVAWWTDVWLAVGIVGWVFAGLGMGLGTASTALVVMSLSPMTQQGRNMSALQSAETLGTSLLTAGAGTIFANLHGRASNTTTFGWVMLAMVALAVFALVAARRIGPVANAVVETP